MSEKVHVKLSNIAFTSERDTGVPKSLLDWTGWQVGDPIVITHLPTVGEAIIIIQKGNSSPIAPTLPKKRGRPKKEVLDALEEDLLGKELLTEPILAPA